MPGVPYTVKQNDKITLSNPARVTAIGGDNLTEFFLFFPDMPPGAQWVFPFTSGFMAVFDEPRAGPNVDASLVAPGSPTPVTTTKIAKITAYNTPQNPSSGVVNPSAPLPWTFANLNIASVVGNSIIVPAVGGKQVFGLQLALVLVSGAIGSTFTVALQDTGGSTIVTFSLSQANITFACPEVPFGNIPLANVGLGLQLNTNITGVQMTGVLIYKYV